jgi:hypothetical protein
MSGFFSIQASIPPHPSVVYYAQQSNDTEGGTLMDAVFLIILVVVGLAFLSNAFRTPAPHIIYVTVPAEPAGGGLGCLPWIIGFLFLLVISGVIKF